MDASSLTALEARLHADLEILQLPAPRWVPARTVDGQPVLDTVIVGGGMAGLTVAAALTQLGIGARVFDRAPEGFEGPWATTARMETLRSVKELSGSALGLPALTFRAWFEAQFGAQRWRELDKIPRLQWAGYLRWYRQVLKLDVRNGQRLVDLQPRGDGLVQLAFADDVNDGARTTVLARHVVLATGRDGLGAPWLPAWANDVPAAQRAHSGEHWPAERLRGLRVAVIGGSASAMDAAATALEAGAARVDLLIRRPTFPLTAKGRAAFNPGLVHGFRTLPDEWKWRFRHFLNVQQLPPPQGSMRRVSRHANAHFHFGAPVQSAAPRRDGSLRLDTALGPLATDFVLFGTGYRNAWAARPEFASISPHVRLWRDRFTPPPGEEDQELAESPDLGPHYEFQERVPDTCPGLERIHCFNYAATQSQGLSSGDIPQISDGAQYLARGLAGKLLAEEAAHYYAAMERHDVPELNGDEWTPAVFPVYRDAD